MPSSAALVKRASDTTLMPPPPPPKRIKRPKNVLDEDVYTDALEHIIARDFFPGLVESRAQTEYLDALSSNDKSWIREAGQKLTVAMTPGPTGRARRGTSMATTVAGTPRGLRETPATGTFAATPDAGSTDEATKPTVDLDLSLTAFQARYTSEDNESFAALLDQQNTAKANKYAFLYHGNKIPGQRQIKQAEEKQKLLAERIEQEAAGTLILRPSADNADRKASYDTFADRQGPRNTFMFAPESVEDTHQTRAQAAEATSFAPPKRVDYASTRLPLNNNAATTNSNPSAVRSTSPPTRSVIDAALAGRHRPSDATSTAMGDSTSGAETPRVAGYAFADAEPSAAELRGCAVDEAQVDREAHEAAMRLMPASEISGSGKNGFAIRDRSHRELVLDRLVAAAKTKAGRPGSGAAIGTPRFLSAPTPSGSLLRSATPQQQQHSAQKGGLTPAARMLAASLGKTPGRESKSAFDDSLQGRGRTPLAKNRMTPIRKP